MSKSVSIHQKLPGMIWFKLPPRADVRSPCMSRAHPIGSLPYGLAQQLCAERHGCLCWQVFTRLFPEPLLLPALLLHRLAQLRSYIEKIRPIDKQLSYQVDKLLRATAKAQASADVDVDAAAAAAAGVDQQAAAAGGEDALQYRPNPQALLSKVPLVGDTTGGGAQCPEGCV
jgi:hypothetical protein